MVTPNRTTITNEEVMAQFHAEQSLRGLSFPVVIGQHDNIRVIDQRVKNRGDLETCTQEIFNILTQPFYDSKWIELIDSIMEQTGKTLALFGIEGNRYYSAANDIGHVRKLIIRITPDIINHIWSGFLIHELSHTNTYHPSEYWEWREIVWEHVKNEWSNIECPDDIPYEVMREILHNRKFHNNFMRNAQNVRDFGLIDDEEYHCHEYGCHEEGVCRCNTIEDVEIKEIDIARIIEKISDGEVFSAYCVDRILRHFGIWNADLWSLDIQHSYYGEEIFGAEHDCETLIDEHLLECLTSPASEKIPYVLELEYGYLLKEAEGRTWTIETVQRDDIELGTEYHKVWAMEEYSPQNYDLPICVVLETKSNLRIIDGYHRMISNNNKKIEVVVGR